MIYKMNLLQGIIRLDTKNSIVAILGFNKRVYPCDKYKTNKIVDILCFNSTKIYCNNTSGIN